MNKLPRYWKPLRRVYEFHPPRPQLIQETMDFYEINRAAAIELIEKEHARCKYFVNDLYQVSVSPHGDDGIQQICIRRLDGAWIRDSRHFQQIKNETCGPEFEAVELYPAESRLVDVNNKWHLWVMPEGKILEAIGWMKRDVQYDKEYKDVPGMRQRPL